MWRRRKVKFGKAFSDNVSFSRRKTTLPEATQLRGWGARITLLYILLISFFFLLVVRLFHLTVVRGQENRELSEFNRIRTAIIHAPRGTLYDRRGTPLTKNIPAFRVTAPCQKNVPCRTSFMTEDQLAESSLNRASVFLEQDFLRIYEYPFETAHVLGHLGELTAEELGVPFYSYQGYLVGDKLGRSGLEAQLEKRLRGTDGKELIEIDSQHNKKRSLGKIDPLPGEDVTLSLDNDLQKVAYEAMGESPGAVVVSKPRTGEILALVSTPSYDANKFHTGLTDEEYKTLSTATDQPLYNKAISGVYPPGSTFKLISSLAALESGKMTKDTEIEDTGILTIGAFSFSNWYFTQHGGKDGFVDMQKAIARSNDIYFYKLGETVGVETLAYWGKKMGLGTKSGINLSGEAEGVMPDPTWRKKVRGDEWYLGDTYHLAIGQGDLAATPLQVNMWTNAIASGGVLCTPTLLKAGTAETAHCKDLGITKSHIDTVAEGMRRACTGGENAPYQGTGWPLFNFTVLKETLTGSTGQGERKPVPVACKTGTSEIGDPEGKTHAWFTAFAPMPSDFLTNVDPSAITGEPEIVVTVLVEKGGEGSSVAGPIAKKILEEWFRR